MKYLLVHLIAFVTCLVPASFVAANQITESTEVAFTTLELTPDLTEMTNIEFDASEHTRSTEPLTRVELVSTDGEMEEVVVTAPRPEPLGKLRRRLSSLIMDKPGGPNWEFLPTFDTAQLQAPENRYARDTPVGNRFEPIGGALLFRLTFNRK